MKLFLSHCGFNSAKEALLEGVPILGVPFSADQPSVAELIESAGAGTFIKFTELSNQNSATLFKELIQNQKYSQNAVRVGRLLVKVCFRHKASQTIRRVVASERYSSSCKQSRKEWST